MKKCKYIILRNNLNEGIYFTKKQNAKEYIKEAKKRNIPGKFEIKEV